MGFKGIVVLLLCIALGLSLTSTFAAQQTPIQQVESAAKNVRISQANLTLGTDSVNFGTITFPNVFQIFSGLADLFTALYGLIFSVTTAFADLPTTVVGFIVAILFFLFVISVIGWWKGNEAG